MPAGCQRQMTMAGLIPPARHSMDAYQLYVHDYIGDDYNGFEGGILPVGD